MNNNERNCSNSFGSFTGSAGLPPVGTGLPAAFDPALAGAQAFPAGTGMYPAPSNIPAPNQMHTGKGTLPATIKSNVAAALPPAVTATTPAGAGMMPSGTGMMPAGTAMPGATQPAIGTQPGWATMPTTLESPFFTPGFLRTQIGRRVRVEFLIGTNSITDRSGTLVAVGSSYIVLQPFESDDLMMCDLYAIKFVTILL